MQAQVDGHMLLRDGCHCVVSALGTQHVGCCENPGLREQGPAPKPLVVGHPRGVLYHYQGLPREEARLGFPAADDPLDQVWQGERGLAAHCKEEEGARTRDKDRSGQPHEKSHEKKLTFPAVNYAITGPLHLMGPG